ncbi:unnamed protein product [Mytilus edulis]|uniref:Myosin motor domain-containing protein n=1 Tax=Mytilus edulis TaxID=6550 RepID=A0A8S3RQK4_MYTED|nr:unnamed protein product [Mytilus edulis]
MFLNINITNDYLRNQLIFQREFQEDPAEVVKDLEDELEFKREQLSKLENTETRDLKRKLVDVQFKLQDKDVMKNKELSAKKKGTTSLLLNKQIIRRVGPADELSKYNRPFGGTQSFPSSSNTKNDIDESVIDPIFAVEDTENHRENSPNHSTCSSTISDVFPEEDQSNIQDTHVKGRFSQRDRRALILLLYKQIHMLKVGWVRGSSCIDSVVLGTGTHVKGRLGQGNLRALLLLFYEQTVTRTHAIQHDLIWAYTTSLRMAKVKGIDDLAKLIDLEDQVILHELKKRYERNVIYTYIGDILVSVNPYAPLIIYGDQIGQDYGNLKLLSDMSPPNMHLQLLIQMFDVSL